METLKLEGFSANFWILFPLLFLGLHKTLTRQRPTRTSIDTPLTFSLLWALTQGTQ